MVLAGTELIVFEEACRMLRLGFLMYIAVITRRWFRCSRAVLAQRHGVFSSLHCPASEGNGYTRGGEGTQPGQVAPKDRGDVPYHRASRSAMKAGVKKEERGGTRSDGSYLPKKPLRTMSPVFLEVAEHLSASK